MITSTQWQLSLDAARSYEDVLVPSILGPAARVLVDAAGLKTGDGVVDVGCGTGAAARLAAECVGRRGRVIALDINEAMLEVARSSAQGSGARVEWMNDNALHPSVPAGSADVVLCAQTLQFLPDRASAVAEMHRMLRPGGRALISVWSDLAENPYFDALAASVSRHLGEEVAAGLRSAFALSRPEPVRALLVSAGFKGVAATAVQLRLQLPALADFVPRHLAATPMAPAFAAAGPAVRDRVVGEISERLASQNRSGSGRVPFSLHIVSGAREPAPGRTKAGRGSAPPLPPT